MLTRLSRGDEPENWRLMLGYSAWAPGQLDRELKDSTGWMVTDFQEELLWDRRRPEVVWHQALDSATQQAVDKLFEI
jgi:putative AlgH/UPF0301 family transcriptional regulator